LISIAIASFILSFYWLKNRIGINFFQTFSLSNYFPFKYLDGPQIIGIDQKGVLLNENFDTYRLFHNWHGVYIEGEGKIIQTISPNERDTSRCLLIINRDAKNWSISHNKFIEVNAGDYFTYKAKVKISNGDPVAIIGVDSFDKDMKIITWCYSKIKSDKLDKWNNLVNSFSIDDEKIKYIRFRISGVGQGEYRFDDIVFKRKS